MVKCDKNEKKSIKKSKNCLTNLNIFKICSTDETDWYTNSIIVLEWIKCKNLSVYLPVWSAFNYNNISAVIGRKKY